MSTETVTVPQTIKMSTETVTIPHTIKMSTETVTVPQIPVKKKSDEYFLHFLKFEECITALAVFGAVSQIGIVVVIIYHLATGRGIDEDLKVKCTVYSIIGIVILLGSSVSEILLMRYVKQRYLPYIQWWMVSSMVFFLFICILTAIAGFTLEDKALWLTLGFLYLVIRIPFQMHFVDKFTHLEIFHKEAHEFSQSRSVLYRRF